MHDGLTGLDGMSRVEGIRACKRLNANQLKLLAIAAMILDHCTVVFVPEAFPARWLLRMLGRIAAPTMCFFIAKGYTHTSNLKKYMGRLLLAAVVSHVPYNLCFGYEIWDIFRATDVMFSLLLGLAALAIWKSEDIAPWKRLLGVVVCCILAYSADWVPVLRKAPRVCSMEVLTSIPHGCARQPVLMDWTQMLLSVLEEVLSRLPLFTA